MRSLILAKCHQQDIQRFVMEGKKLQEFRSLTKFYMNFYRFKLHLARLKLKDIPDVRYIYIIF
jgi:hypothetical protein